MITLRITTPNGTIIALDIPTEGNDASKTVETTQSAMVYQEPVQTREEEPSGWVSDDIKPATKTYKSVEDMLDDHGLDDILDRLNSTGEKEEEEGLGRIGGVGERKDRGEEEEKPELNLDGQTQTIFTLKYPCQGGQYTAPVRLINNFIKQYGEELVERELYSALNWLITNPKKVKGMAGTGRFLTGWIKRATDNHKRGPRKVYDRDYNRQENRQETSAGSLITSNAKETVSGW
jgi:hypothetical protein